MTVSTPLEERLAQRVVITADGCHEWTGARVSKGYGSLRLDNRIVAAHRAVYEHFVGPIPEGMQIDHLCRNRACVNLEHLEPVTPRENSRRGFGVAGVNARKTHCPYGHEYTPDNTYVSPRGHRKCRTCYRLRFAALPRAEGRTTCVNGHPFTPENRYVAPRTGHSTCRICAAANMRRYRAARAA